MGNVAKLALCGFGFLVLVSAFSTEPIVTPDISQQRHTSARIPSIAERERQAAHELCQYRPETCGGFLEVIVESGFDVSSSDPEYYHATFIGTVRNIGTKACVKPIIKATLLDKEDWTVLGDGNIYPVGESRITPGEGRSFQNSVYTEGYREEPIPPCYTYSCRHSGPQIRTRLSVTSNCKYVLKDRITSEEYESDKILTGYYKK